jgi:NADH dehydrogenase
MIYGPGDDFVNRFASLARRLPFVPVIGSGEGRLQPIEVRAVAQCFARALTEPRAVGGTYDLCGPEPLAFTQILDAILAVTGRRRVKAHLPLPLARACAAMLEVLCDRVLRVAPPLTCDQITMLQEDNVGDPRPAMAAFGVRPVPFREGLAGFLSPQPG